MVHTMALENKTGRAGNGAAFASRQAARRIIAITGATGRIGRALVERFSREPGISLRLIARNLPEGSSLPENAEFFKADISMPETYAAALNGASAAVHLAGLVSFHAKSSELMEQNAANAGIFASACAQAGVPKLVFASSIAVYGKGIEGREVDESFPASPTTDYGMSKLAGEREILKHKDKLKIAILRLGLVYGTGIDFGYYKMLGYLRSGKMKLIGDGGNFLPFVHSSDVAEAFYLACSSDRYESGSVFNIVGELKTQKECLGLASKSLGVAAPSQSVNFALASALSGFKKFIACSLGMGDCQKAGESDEFLHVIASDRRIVGRQAHGVLGFDARVGVESGIGEVVKAYLKDSEGTR